MKIIIRHTGNVLQKAEKKKKKNPSHTVVISKRRMCKISKLNPPITGLLEDFMQKWKDATLEKQKF